MPLVECSRQGCHARLDPSDPSLSQKLNQAECVFHPGRPVFHDAYKSWSCCPSKKFLDFDDFVSHPGCHTGSHALPDPSLDIHPASLPSPAPAPGPGPQPSTQASTKQPTTIQKDVPRPSVLPVSTPPPKTTEKGKEEGVEEKKEKGWKIMHDPEDAQIEAGMECRRTGCTVRSDPSITAEERQTQTCLHHPAPPVFREGSKGYLCCKRRVLEFSEFLTIKGCTTTQRHQFLPPVRDTTNNNNNDGQAETVQPRMDHYQTPTTVICSVYAKKVDKARSTITFNPDSIAFDLLFQESSKRFKSDFALFSPIDPLASSFEILGTKVELTLVKDPAVSWPHLQPLAEGQKLPEGFNLTFSASKIGA